MTRLNPDYYTPTIDTTSSLRYQPFSTLSSGTSFDLTGAYARCGGQYSPICNRGIVYGGDFSYNEVSPTRHYDMRNLNEDCSVATAPLFLTNGTCGGDLGGILSPVKYDSSGRCLGSVSSRNAQTAAGSYKNWWSPTGAPSLYTTQLFLGWCYKNVVISNIQVIGWSRDLSNVIYSDYNQHDYENYPNITGIYGDIFVGGVEELTQLVKRQRRRTVNGITIDPMIGTVLNTVFPVKHAEWTLLTPTTPWLEVHTKTGDYSACYNLCASRYLFNTGYIGCDEIGTTWTSEGVSYDTRAQSGRVVGLYSLLTSGQSVADVQNNQHKYYLANATKDLICKIIATYGLYFGGSGSTVTGSEATSQLLHCPVPDSDGVFRGTYVSGTDIATAPNADWGGDVSNPYIWWDGEEPGVKNIYKGTANIRRFYFGANTVSKIYLGNSVIYSEGEEPEPPTPPEPPEPTTHYASVIGIPEDPDTTPTKTENYIPVVGDIIHILSGTKNTKIGVPQAI